MTNSEDSVLFAGYTHNFWTGFLKLSDSCQFCSAVDTTEIKHISDETFNKSKILAGRKTIFTCSYSDFFIPNADDWRDDACKVIRATKQHIWIIITNKYLLGHIGVRNYPGIVLNNWEQLDKEK